MDIAPGYNETREAADNGRIRAMRGFIQAGIYRSNVYLGFPKLV
jgi:hypothetical protein